MATPLTERQLDAYLARIGVARPARPDATALEAIHRAHLLAFTWEALDAYLGRPSSLDPADAFAKLVGGRRGGWCYEMNGLFGAVLAAMGFRVTRLCGAVNRPDLGTAAIGNHLTLQVELDRPWLAEVGVADALIAPVPMVPGPIRQRGFAFALIETEDGWMRLENHPLGLARTVDFRPGHGDEASIAAAHRWLSTDPASPFTATLALFRHTDDGYVCLHDDRLRRITAAGVEEEPVGSAGRLAEVLGGVFAIAVPEVGAVWEKVMARRAQRAAA